jgi:hypothetical protein
MAATQQFKLNAVCIARQLRARRWAKARFHCAGLLRAVWQIITGQP